MESYLVRFLDFGRLNQNWSIYTLKGYRSDIRAFYRWLAVQGVTEPAQITRQHIERYDVMQGDLDKRPQTRRRKIAAIRAFTSWLVEEEKLLPTDPARRIKLPVQDDPQRQAPTPAEKAALFDGATRLPTEYEAAMASVMLAGMFYAGLRPMEVIALDLSDVDLEKRNLIVRKGKGRKRREVPINDTLAAHILTWLPVRKPSRIGEPLIVTPQHRAMSYYMLRTTFVKVKVAGGLRSAKTLTAHCLRHWFASKLFQNNVDIEAIRRLLGHVNLNTTQVYLHHMGNELHDAVHGLDEGPAAPVRQPNRAQVRTRTHRSHTP